MRKDYKMWYWNFWKIARNPDFRLDVAISMRKFAPNAGFRSGSTTRDLPDFRGLNAFPTTVGAPEWLLE
jgi:hypothetical protein